MAIYRITNNSSQPLPVFAEGAQWIRLEPGQEQVLSVSDDVIADLDGVDGVEIELAE